LRCPCIRGGIEYYTEAISVSVIEEIFKVLVLVGEANNGRWRRISDYLKLEILSTERHFEVTRGKCFAHLQKATVNQFDIRERDEDFFATELCFKLIDRDLAKTRAINWLLEYLHNPRMGNIDVIRYKIETYIVESDDSDLSASLLSLLSTESPSVRENAADMIGQKSIPSAGKYLRNALAVEENPYTSRSIITAIARQNATEAIDQIIDWVARHDKSWWEEPISITLKKVSEEAVRKLDPSGEALRKIQELLSSGRSENRE
jgi:HEAT repeat protein